MTETPADDLNPYDADDVASKSSTLRKSPLLNLLLKSTGARIASLIVQGICAILATRLVIGTRGFSEYGYIVLVAGIPAILSFMDLGVGAAITNLIAKNDADNTEESSRVLNTALRTLVIGAIGVVVFSFIAYALAMWSRLLGIPSTQTFNADLAVTVVLVLFATTLPLNVGGSLLLGAGKNSQLISLRMIQPPLTLLLLWLMIKAGWSANLLPAAWQISALITALIVIAVAEQTTPLRPLRSLAQVFTLKGLPGARIRHTALPMFVIMLGLPIAFQTDRIILSNRTDLVEVANYSVVATLQGPLMALVAAAGLSLWPHFYKGRGLPTISTDFYQALALFVFAGFAAAIALLLIGPLLVPLVSKDLASIGQPLFIAAAFVVLIQSSHTPAGMFLTDEAGLTFQAKSVTAMAVVNLGLSWILAGMYGAAGPYLGTAIAIATCQLGPTIWVVTRSFRQSSR